MARPVFQRSISEASERSLSDEQGVALLEFCAADPDLSVFLRGTYLNVYWEGFEVFRVTLPGGKLQIGSAKADAPPQGFPRSLKDLAPPLLPSLVGWVKEKREGKLASIPELRFEARVVRDNRSAASPVLVIDRQIARPGVSERLDLLLLDVGSKRLALAELKADGNPQTTGHVLDQLDGYRKTFGGMALRRDCEKHLGQLQRLGVITNPTANIDIEADPMLVVMLAGFTVQSLGGGRTRGHFKKLLAKKKADYPNSEIRMGTFPHAIQGQFAIPTPLTHMPTIEEWSDLYL